MDTRDSKRVYGFKCGLVLLSEVGFNLSLTYTPAGGLFSGEAEYSGRLLGVDNPSISMAYDKAYGFKITSRPIEAAGGRSPCGELVGLAFDKAMKTKFNMKF
jgi:hypothetical protein